MLYVILRYSEGSRAIPHSNGILHSASATFRMTLFYSTLSNSFIAFS